ncbi:prion-inhibition and propagation, helo domain-containing protein [Jackrogersella minutella]|nr:prion-inhibition and propagation, helo domain-containing protein [Jackrogersella minutella]
MQWAEHVRLLQSDYDPRLDDEVTQRAVARILGCIRFLLGNEAQLRSRYGLKEGKDQRRDHKTNRTDVISGHRMAKFVEDFETMKLRSNILDKTTSFTKKARWVICDKAKFEELVRELAHFTTKLTQLVPVSYFPIEQLLSMHQTRILPPFTTLRG